MDEDEDLRDFRNIRYRLERLEKNVGVIALTVSLAVAFGVGWLVDSAVQNWGFSERNRLLRWLCGVCGRGLLAPQSPSAIGPSGIDSNRPRQARPAPPQKNEPVSPSPPSQPHSHGHSEPGQYLKAFGNDGLVRPSQRLCRSCVRAQRMPRRGQRAFCCPRCCPERKTPALVPGAFSLSLWK